MKSPRHVRRDPARRLREGGAVERICRRGASGRGFECRLLTDRGGCCDGITEANELGGRARKLAPGCPRVGARRCQLAK